MTTNVTRLLALNHIPYETRSYPVDESDLSGVHAAAAIGMPPEQLFKTLVLTGAKGDLFVCVIPCAEEVDLKKAARVMGEKSAAMLPVKQLLEKTGYVRGGCSPIGMKKKLPTFIDETALLHERIAVSAGVRGTMALIDPNHLIDYTGAKLADLTLV